MAKPNYSFEKRQKEIAKKKKQEEKLAEKRQRKTTAENDGNETDSSENDAAHSAIEDEITATETHSPM